MKSPHRSELGWAEGMEDPKSNRGAGVGGGAEQDENYQENVRLPLKSVSDTCTVLTGVSLCRRDCLLGPGRWDKTSSLCTWWRGK